MLCKAVSLLAVSSTCICASGLALHKQNEQDTPTHVGHGAQHRTSPWWVPAETPKVYIDGVTDEEMTVSHTTGWVSEFFYSMKAGPQGVYANENKTHVWIPYHTILQSTYVRYMYEFGDHEYGVAEQTYMWTPMSGFSPDSTVAVAEKMHGFERAILTEPEAPTSHPSWWPQWFSSMMTYMRRLFRNAGIILTGGAAGLVSASGIPNLEVKSFVRADGGVPNAKMNSSMAALKADLAAKGFTSDGDYSDPVMSSLNCFHFDDIDAKENDEGVWMPLNVKISAYKGQSVSAPWKSFEALQGTSTWYYDAETDRVEIYYATVIQSRVSNRKDIENASHIYIGQADGTSQEVTPLYKRFPIPSFIAGFVFHSLANFVPEDGSAMFDSPAVTCPPNVADYVASSLENKDIVMAFAMGLTLNLTLLDVSSILSLWTVVPAITSAIGCVSTFLKPDHVNATTYDAYMGTAYLHALLEVPTNKVVEVLGSPKWHSVNSSLI